ncbi:MAG: glucose 1-dehydrogenase [Acidimicrobiales bacterium]|nr:glucose 1-dehydrogenase [Acidimicrobiales bacterium]
MGRLDDKVALITGAARGQGAAEARLFAAEGARVYLSDVLDDEGAAVAADIGAAASYHHLDVTDGDAWITLVEQIVETEGRLDVLVNNAGIFRVMPTVLTSEAEYRQIIDINQVGTFLGMKTVIPTMVQAESGSIVNISSVAGLQGAAGTMAYAASKWAVRGMTKVAAKEVAPFGVRVNSVHPGIIDTPMMAEATVEGAMLERVVRAIPMGQVAQADDVANLVLYLASDESRYSTGSEFVVDGGMTA